ncbi:MAG TPA: hypothetical protein VNH64_05065 [Parvularculaceae bacterium]|nr:hypothetical protein [Parvularculaceae bacterium]
MTAPSFHIVSFSASAVIAAAGALFFLAPPPPPPIPADAVRAESSPFQMDAAAAHRFAGAFDLSALPPPEAAKPPPPDPTTALRVYRYLGGATAGERNAALFERGDSIVTLTIGSALAGFSLVSFDSERALFRQGDVEAVLPLQKQ